ncbi:MAG: cation:proton antiporter [Planctomycetaceae bacterium]
MHDTGLLLTLTGGLTAALVLGYVTQRLRLSPIVGYLVAGIAVGPFTPGFAADRHVAEQLAEVGVILLMFGVGLRFQLRELTAVWRVAVPGALVQSAVATLLGAAVGRLLGWDWTSGLVFGGAISVASTVVLVRVLSDAHALHSRAGHVAVGWLVGEDLLTVVARVVLPAVVAGGPGASLPVAVGVVLLKIGALVALLAVAGGRLIPRLLEGVAATRSRELFTLAVLVTALGIAVGSAQVFGVSMALGAFVAGMIVGRSEFGLRAAAEALPMRDAFAVLFFVSVGMMFDPAAVLRAPALLVATLAIVLVAKPAVALAVARMAGEPARVALPVAAALAQIGEFSFILAALGRDLGVLPTAAVDALVATAIISITLAPLGFRGAEALEARLARRRAADDGAAAEPDPADEAHRAVVVGYGPVGQTVCQLLLDNGIEPTVIELNLDTVRRLRAFDVRAVYGDASRPETLAEAGVGRARHLVLTAGAAGVEEVVRRAKELNPAIHVLARSQYVRELPRPHGAAAEDAFADEGEVALALTARILERLGATAEQIDRERRRIEETFRAG